MGWGTCNKCSREAERFGLRCETHYCCDDCGGKNDLVYRVEGLLCESCFRVRVEKRIATFDGDTDYTRNITCPYCGHVVDDSWEWDDCGEEECSDCENVFFYQRHVVIDYSTSKDKDLLC